MQTDETTAATEATPPVVGRLTGRRLAGHSREAPSGRVAILAYGSLREDLGEDLAAVVDGDSQPLTKEFRVAFARLSTSRGGAPTLVPVPSGGAPVHVSLIRLMPKVTRDQAREMLYRRERHIARDASVGLAAGRCPWIVELSGETAISEFLPAEDHDAVAGISVLLYTELEPSLSGRMSAGELADRAIESARTPAGATHKDGISYLHQMIDLGVPSELTADYQAEILAKLNARDLDDAWRIAQRQAHAGLTAGPTTGPIAATALSGAAAGPAVAGNTPSSASLRDLVLRVAGFIGTGVGVLGFVALVGGADFWLRFSSAGLPADEAVGDLSNGQLVVVGTRDLFPFVALVLVEALVLFLIEEALQGRITVPPLSYVARYAARRDPIGASRGALIVSARTLMALASVGLAVGADLLLSTRWTQYSLGLTIAVALGLAVTVLVFARDASFTRFLLAALTATAVFSLYAGASRTAEAPEVRPVALVVDGKPLAGLYVAASSEQLFIGEVCAVSPSSENGNTGTGSLVDLPRSHVSLTLVGSNAPLREAIVREQSLLDSLPKLSPVNAGQLASVEPALPSRATTPCTGPSAEYLRHVAPRAAGATAPAP